MNTKWLRYGVLALVTLILLGGFGMWFWSLGAVAGETASVIQVVVKSGPVESRASASDTWTPVEHAMELEPGSQVRTGAGGEADILWGDRGVTRLDANTQVIIEAMPADATQSTGVSIKVKVEAGRVWSRMLKLLDLQSSFEVETRDVVATVRGTAFGIGVNPTTTEAAVTRSVIEMNAKDGMKSTLLREGEWGSFHGKGTPILVRPLTKNDTWAVMNAERDRAYDEQMLDVMRSRLQGVSSAKIVGPNWLINLSEDLRLGIIGPIDKPELAERYMMRQLALYVEDHDASHMDRIVALSRTSDVKPDLVLGMVRTFLEGEQTASVELRDLRGRLIGTKAAGEWYAEVLNVDDDIDTLLFGTGIDEVTRTALHTAAVASLEQLEAGIVGPLDLVDNDRVVAATKLRAMRRRLELVQGQTSDTAPEGVLNNVLLPTPVEKPTSGTVPKTTTPTTDARTFQRIALLVTPTEAEIGASVRVALYGIRADGTTADLTSVASIAPERFGDGTYALGIFRPKVSGAITLTAQYKDAVGLRSTSASLYVLAPKQVNGLVGLAFEFIGPTTVPCSTTVPFKVFASYADGTKKDVTVAAVVATENGKLFGVADGKLLSYCAATVQSTAVYASYTENGVTKTATATVTLDPGPAPVTAPPSTFNPNAIN